MSLKANVNFFIVATFVLGFENFSYLT